jgi:hypothetical protein
VYIFLIFFFLIFFREGGVIKVSEFRNMNEFNKETLLKREGGVEANQGYD